MSARGSGRSGLKPALTSSRWISSRRSSRATVTGFPLPPRISEDRRHFLERDREVHRTAPGSGNGAGNLVHHVVITGEPRDSVVLGVPPALNVEDPHSLGAQ